MTDEAPQEPSAETIAGAASRAPDEPSAVETPASMPGGPAAPQVGGSSSSSDLAAGAEAAVARPRQPVLAEAPPVAPVEAPETAGAPLVVADVVSEDGAAVPPVVSGAVRFPLADEGPADSPPDPFDDDDEDDLTWDAIAVALAAEPPMPGTHRAEVAPSRAGESPARTHRPADTPAAVEPAASEAAATEPAVTESAVTEPAAVEPAAVEPAATESAATEPTATEPAATETVATETAATEPAATESAATEPAATESAATELAATELAATEPAATEPAATESSAPNMAATDPTAAEPAATESAAVEPAGIEGADIEPAGVGPARAGPPDGAPAAVEQDALAPPLPQEALDRSPATAGGSEDASDGPEETVAAASVGMPSAAEWDEVAEFWALRPKPVAATPVPGGAGPEPSPWSAEEDEELVGLRGLAADWRAAQAAELAGTADGWQDDQRPGRWRRVVAPLAGRWSTLRTGERVNVVLYALTGVSIVAMALELLAGPDAAPTKLRTTPAPVVSPTTVRQSTTITFTIPTTTPEPAPAPAPASGPAPIRPPATVTQATTPPAPAPTEPAPPPPEPQPEPEPTAPPRTSPPTTRETPPTNPGFPEPTPPVLPSFP